MSFWAGVVIGLVLSYASGVGILGCLVWKDRRNQRRERDQALEELLLRAAATEILDEAAG